MTTNERPVDTAERLAPAPGAWPSGGRVAGRFRTCDGCGDYIWPAEHIYPAAAGGDTSDDANARCAVCEVKSRAAEGWEECGACGGNGHQSDGSPCSDCLGGGRTPKQGARP